MVNTEYFYFDGSSVSVTYDDYHDGPFMIICEDSFLYLMAKSNLEFSIVDKGNKVYTMYMNPYVDTYYIECDKNTFWQLVNKYCTKDARSSLMSDWDLYGSEPGTVQKRLHVFQFDDGDILFSRSEESNDWFYLSAPDHFWKAMDSRHNYKELEMKEDDRFKNRDNFKLIEIHEYEMIKIFSSIVDRKHVEEKMKQLFEECKQWTETQ